MKYDPNGPSKLLDYLDDFVYSYKRAFDAAYDEATCIKFFKNKLPQPVHVKLLTEPKYRDAKSISELTDAVRLYDITKQDSASSNSHTNPDIAALLEHVVHIRKEVEETRNEVSSNEKDQDKTNKALVAAIQTTVSDRER